MASRTVVNSVAVVDAPPPNLPQLQQELDRLKARFPGAVLGRYLGQVPQIGERVHLAPGAALIGAVVLADDVSIWYGCVLRADINRIEVRERSNIQDGTVVHLGDNDGTFVAEEVVVGHRAVLHGCHIEGGCLIGIGATILDGARIGQGSIVGAGALVPAGSVIPAHSLVLGMPARVVKQLSASDEEAHRKLALKYTRLNHNYRVG
jgi:carbonic anhydrase/acetyltransferase-like protein (isoleucine patch superfamily)